MIQPLDIKTVSFKKGMFGYKTADVDSFIDAIYKAYDELYRENTNLTSSLEKLNKSLQDSRLKMFDMETKIQQLENVSSYKDDELVAKKNISENFKPRFSDYTEEKQEEVKQEEPKAEKPASKFTLASEKKGPVKETGTSRFFKKAEEELAHKKEEEVKLEAAKVAEQVKDEDLNFEFDLFEDNKSNTVETESFTNTSYSDNSSEVIDDDEIFVGEIEEARKPKSDRMMIGDGEEEEDLDFEFL